MIEVAFNLDEFTLDSAYVAACSLLANTSEPVRLLFLLESSAPDLPTTWIQRFTGLASKKGSVEFIKIDNTAFRHCKSLFGSHATYLRIYAPKFAQTSRLIYSDTDVIFTTDIKELYSLPLNNATIALPGGVKVSTRSDKERAALTASGRQPNDLYYGSGLAVIDVSKYLQKNKVSQCEESAKQWAPNLLLHEQTLWNCVFSPDEILDLEEKWCQSPPLKKEEFFADPTPGIIHFAGSPKPWDLFGEFFHHSYHHWAQAAKKAHRGSQVVTKYFNPKFLQRAYRIRKQYAAWFGPIANKL